MYRGADSVKSVAIDREKQQLEREMQQIIQQLEQLQERYQLSSSTKGGLERERAKTNKQAAGKTVSN